MDEKLTNVRDKMQKLYPSIRTCHGQQETENERECLFSFEYHILQFLINISGLFIAKYISIYYLHLIQFSTFYVHLAFLMINKNVPRNISERNS